MTNLFSSFDPGTTILGLNLRLNWLRITICLIIAPQLFWLCNSQWSKSLEVPKYKEGNDSVDDE